MAIIKELVVNGVVYSQCSREYLVSQGVPEAVAIDAEAAQILENMQTARRAAYAAESDPLYLEWQYDRTSESEAAWREKVAEIKAKFPLPGE